jgi:KUP system potassium uptake protein
VPDTHGPADGRPGAVALLALGALGVVYGDIGTSPLYAFRESFEGHDIAVTETSALGVCSLVFWALLIIITVKYLLLVMRADNQGEGGILALTALVLPPGREQLRGAMAVLVMLGVFGTALLYGDGMITPAISVLSAVEGFEVATPAVERWVIPIAVVILVGLFSVQRRGTGSVGRVFGPVMVVWFGVLAVLGLTQIAREPSVLQAVNPAYAVRYFTNDGLDAFLSLGSIFLVVTGGEALYADMGHFGRKPIEWGWFGLVLPALLLNYFGQGALLLRDPEAIESPFYRMVPDAVVTPLAVLATAATVIASQALISGAFSLTVQAVKLDYLPRVAITHTSGEHAGQIYVPVVNWALMIACVGLVLGFRTSSNLAAAYGIAVTTTMAITTLILARVAMQRWGWSLARTLAVALPLLIIDLAFFTAQLAKIPHGGWFALTVAVVLMGLMTTWRRGRQLVSIRIRRAELPVRDVLRSAHAARVPRVAGTSIFLFKDDGMAPPALLTNLRHNHVLHEQVGLVSVVTTDHPYVPDEERCDVEDLGDGAFRIVLHYGFMQEPDVPAGLAVAAQSDAGFRFDPDEVTYYIGRETVLASNLEGMASWRERLFGFLARSASSAARFFNLPPSRVFEVGSQVEI